VPRRTLQAIPPSDTPKESTVLALPKVSLISAAQNNFHADSFVFSLKTLTNAF
jgi:hypothetical protein